jgi:hypothetical protein
MSYKEADFQRDFRKYAKNCMPEQSFVYELKVSKKSYLNFGRLEEHQKYALRAASEGIAHYKIPDEGISQKPFDGFQVTGVDAYVGIMYEVDVQHKEFYLIPIKKFLEAKEEVERKSLTRDKAGQIGERHELA